jgi:hypothetical protein
MDDLFRLGLLSSLASVYALLFLFLLSVLVGYILLRLRDNQRQERDPELGIKVALHFFLSVSILLVLFGLTTVVVDLLTSKRAAGLAAVGDEMSTAQRTGWGLTVAGGLLSLLHFALLKGMTNDSRRPAARRFFLGWRFVINGLMFVFAVSALIVTMFQKEMGNEDLRKTYLGMLLIWGPSWLIHLILLRVASDGLYRPERLVPPEVAPREPSASPVGERTARSGEAPRARPTSGPSCSQCNAPLSQRELDEGWCDSCGKKLPSRPH